MQRTGGRCMDCREQFEALSLEMHPIDKRYARDKSHHFGYSEGNVEFLCKLCHGKR